MSEPLIKVENVSKKFCRDLKKSLWYGVKDVAGELVGRGNSKEELRPGEFWSVNDVSFELKRGECLGLIGPNGAGKSTLLKMLNGLIKPDRGRISLRGRVGALIELGAGFNPILTGRENIYVNGAVLGFTKEEIDRKFDDIVDFAELDEFIDAPVQNYSSGMKVRLGFAVAAQMEPDVLIIDEVLAVGDIGFRVKCLNRIHEILDKAAVIFVSHSMPFVARICTQAMVMQKGVSVYPVGPVPEGIDYYHEQFDTGQQKILGSGEVAVQSVRVNGESEKSIPLVPFGGSLHLSLNLMIQSKCKTIGTRLAIWNVDQRPVTDIVNEDYQTFTWTNNEEYVSLDIELPNLRLASGRHSIAIAILDNDTTRVLCRVENAVSFTMGHHLSTGCETYLAAHWSKTLI
jgi:homopolymeric O-antigen transport system ATP-binding protein